MNTMLGWLTFWDLPRQVRRTLNSDAGTPNATPLRFGFAVIRYEARFQAMNCLATFIQSLRDTGSESRKMGSVN